jgi:aryl-alcohol dehydrogenase-like predicted oxidoreductase
MHLHHPWPNGLNVRVAGLDCGGFCRLGLRSDLAANQSARLIHEVYDRRVNFIDTALSYGTEGEVGKALKTIARDKPVIATNV